MAALLGYLVALAMFLGSGYVGLEWLASPDVGTHAQSRKKSPTHTPTVASNKPAALVADAKEAGEGTKEAGVGGIKSVTMTASPGKPVDREAGVTGGTSKSQKPDGVPAGGCMPIGVTASGQMVFPLQCRELIDRQHGPASPPTSVKMAAPAPAPQDTGTRKTATSDNVVASGPNQSVPPVGDKLTEENDKAKQPSNSNLEVSLPVASEILPKNALAPVPPTPHAERSAVVTKPRRTEKMRPGHDRSKLVAMTLETLKFTDGHLEHRLVPLKPSGRTAMQTDWYNPLGLR